MKVKICEAIAYALNDLGVSIVTHVPGFGASEAFTSYNNLVQKNNPFSYHEEVAFTIAHSASIVGKRSACLIKAQGFAKAANSTVDALYTSLTAGFVTFIFEDHTGNHSDNIMEAEQLLHGMSFPYQKAEPNNLYQSILSTYLESEQRRLPFVILVDAKHVNTEIEISRDESHKKKLFNYNRDVLSHIVHPLFAEYQYKVFTANKLGGDPSMIERPGLPEIPDSLPGKFKEPAMQYKSFFDVFKEFKGDFASGDTSSSSVFALPPYNCIDAVTYIGGSIPLAIGAYLSGKKYTWALSGDFGFISAGHLGLLEVINRNIPIKVIIFNNKQAAATGGQPVNRKLLMRILAGYEAFIKNISNPGDPIEVSQVLDEAISSDELRIVIVQY